MVDVVELRVQARRGHRGAHQRARGHAVQPALQSGLELVLVEGEEVRALLALDVDDLDVLALPDLVGQGRGLVHAEVEPRLRQRRRQLEVDLRPRAGPLELDDERRRRQPVLGRPVARGGHHGQHVALGHERLRGAGGPVRAEQPPRTGVMRFQPARVQGAQKAVAAPLRPEPAEHRGRRIGDGAQGPEVLSPVGRQRGELGRLAAIGIDHGQAVAGTDLHHRGRTGPDPPGLERAVDGLEAREQRGSAALRPAGLAHAFAAGSLASSLSACSDSCLARSRLPAASSFFTSFSTTRRL